MHSQFGGEFELDFGAHEVRRDPLTPMKRSPWARTNILVSQAPP
jgi:hypothetical protein